MHCGTRLQQACYRHTSSQQHAAAKTVTASSQHTAVSCGSTVLLYVHTGDPIAAQQLLDQSCDVAHIASRLSQPEASALHTHTCSKQPDMTRRTHL